MKKLRHSNSIKKTCVSLLSAMVVLVFVSCDPDDENDGRGDKASKSLQSLGFSVSVENQKTSTRSDMVSADNESFTFTIGENNDCEITCLVTDMEGNTSVSPTRGTPVGTTVPYNLDGTIPVISEVTNSIESMYGTDGIAITAYRKDKDDNVSLLTPNSDDPAETAGNVVEFRNLKYTYAATAFDGEGSWTTASNINGYYWYETEKLRFYAAAPATLAPNYEYPTAGKASFSYTVPADNANQKDVLIGATDFLTRPTLIEDKPYSMEVEIPTYHALCAVRFVIDNRELVDAVTGKYTQRPKEFTLKSITLTNLKTGGTCTYTYDSSSSAKSADCITWDLTSSAIGDYSCTFGTSGSGTAIAKTIETYNLHSSDGSASGTQLTNVFLLVPQELAEDCEIHVTYTYPVMQYSTTTGIGTVASEDIPIDGQLVGHGATLVYDPVKGKDKYVRGIWEPGKMYTYVIPSKYLKRTKEIFKIDGDIHYDSSAKQEPYAENSWHSITDLAGTGYTLDVTDIKVIELDFSEHFKAFFANVNKSTPNGAHAHLWIEGTLLDGSTYNVNGTPDTNPNAVNGTGYSHTHKEIFTYDGVDYPDVLEMERYKGTYTDDKDNFNINMKYVFDVSMYQSIKIKVYFHNDEGGGNSCTWDLRDFTIYALETEPW